jgi:hypothetical protein
VGPGRGHDHLGQVSGDTPDPSTRPTRTR